MADSPYDRLPTVPSFGLHSADVADGQRLPLTAHSAIFGFPGGADTSPQLSWSGFPAQTQSFVVTMFDPDAPTPSGFWHWVVADIPADVTSLPAGAGDGDTALPAGAFHLPNDARAPRYVGAAPPPGTGRHRYLIAVHAIDAPSVVDLGVQRDGTPAALSYFTLAKTLARAVIEPWADADSSD
ncbi:MAG TPA: YbhB/YbcL family Raf kinase inhibitor-like protein [Pseudonocardiaceae bacterium]|nr:YbhB/YbcL family Raf kinase inhibitor-like protein [Pseudonocardiaceae bacterium]